MSPITRSLSVFAVLSLAACASSADPEPMPAPTPAAGSGVAFSALQVNRGQQTLQSTCTQCHSVGEFSAPAFKTRWSSRSVGDLYEFILTSMPDDAPGTLTPEQAVQLTSFILSLNGFEPGSSQMDADQAALDDVSLSGLSSQ